MSTLSDGFKNSLPQTGWVTDEEFAAAFHMEKKSFRRLLRARGMPHALIGQTGLIDVDRFYKHISTFMIFTDNDKGKDNGPTTKTKPKPKPKIR